MGETRTITQTLWEVSGGRSRSISHHIPGLGTKECPFPLSTNIESYMGKNGNLKTDATEGLRVYLAKEKRGINKKK